MPFQKGRKKTGGRTKGGSKPKPVRLVDKLKAQGFDYIKEFAEALKNLPTGTHPVGTRYSELRDLLPFMAPKLKEKEVELIDEPFVPAPIVTANGNEITAEDLMAATMREINDEPNNPPVPAISESPVGEGSAELQVQESSEENLPNVGNQQEDN